MSKLLILYDYNSYYNRIIKRLSSFQDYLNLITPVGNNPAAYKGFIRENTNFNIEDGITARHIINIKSTDPLYAKVEQPNYVVQEQTYTENNVQTKKVSRWFVIEAVRVRGSQWELMLKRDVLADFYDEVLDAPVYIERGNLNNPDNTLLFNRENMTFNQIKKGEYLLNKTKLSGKGQGWIVGYLARDAENSDIGPCVSETIAPADAATNYDDLPQALKDSINAGYFDLYDENNISLNLYCLTSSSNASRQGAVATVMANKSARLYFPYPSTYDQYKGAYMRVASNATDANASPDLLTYGFDTFFPTIVQQVKNIAALDPNYQPTTTDWRTQYQGIIVLKNGKLYELQFTTGTNISYSKEYSHNSANSTAPALLSAVDQYMYQVYTHSSYFSERVPSYAEMASRLFQTNIPASRIQIQLVEKEFGKVSTTIHGTRNPNYEAPYDIFCIPYGSVGVKNGNTLLFTTLNNIALSTARAIALVGTSSKVYDIQILPYCPFAEILNNDGDIDISGFTVEADYDFITKTIGGITTNVGIVIYPKNAKGTFDISISSSEDIFSRCIEIVGNPLEKKIASETTFARFVSPNFASMFEINVQKNKGIIDINVDYFLKPYSPYIHVAPYFKGLYGEDYNDPKGLVCSGDFSIATASSKWEEYQVQNKNYEQIFNRQIENIDVNNSIALKQAKWEFWGGAGGQALVGAGAGAIVGAAIGNVPGAIAGAAVGGVAGGGTSAVGGYFDIKYLKQQQKEARSLFSDMYAYELGNIKALPYSLTRISAFTPNNKIFPFIEFYDCSDIEKQALRNKLVYNGATIGVIATIRQYLGNRNYVQGKLIRLEGINEDSHVITEIASEINEGAYYYGNSTE